MAKKYFIIISTSILIICILVSTYLKTHQFQKENQNKINQFAQLLEMDRRKEQPLKLPILVYHYIEIVTDTRDTIRKSLSIMPSIFEQQLQILQQNEYTPISLNDLINYYHNKQNLPQKPIILTFDDGYEDFYTDAYPILQKYQIPATIYITTGFIDYTHNYLTKDQLLEISKSKLIEIGAHGVDHYNLHFSNSLIVKNEIINSKQILEKLLNRPITHFAYPYGGYSDDAILNLKKNKFETAVTMDYGNIQTYANRYLLKRIRPGSSTGDYFLSLLK
jgi:peptidoglycan/xylan/chitin deacetylase (PgdA/CDA1 family)